VINHVIAASHNLILTIANIVRKVISIELIEFKNRYFCIIYINLKLIKLVVVKLFNYKGS
jgi:hypothetical protein